MGFMADAMQLVFGKSGVSSAVSMDNKFEVLVS